MNSEATSCELSDYTARPVRVTSRLIESLGVVFESRPFEFFAIKYDLNLLLPRVLGFTPHFGFNDHGSVWGEHEVVDVSYEAILSDWNIVKIGRAFDGFAIEDLCHDAFAIPTQLFSIALLKHLKRPVRNEDGNSGKQSNAAG